ncbi:hypothetical protein [Blastococcus deserti]|uniref:Uncharacterized protein n=1 Tax=Blastococcus deserti TaxID=2259033 RepID=A0ABW4X5E4_9ACTN
MGGLFYNEVVLGGVGRTGWWLVDDDREAGPARTVAGPFPDRADANWAAGVQECGDPDGVRPVFGTGRADGGLGCRPSPQDRAWLAHLEAQLDRLPHGWDADLSDDDDLVTLVVEVTAALAEAGLPLSDGNGAGTETGGASLTPEPALGGILVTWRQHDRMSVEQIHGAAADVLVHDLMSRALADVLRLRGFAVDTFGSGNGHLVRLPA